ncbi:putative T7SS-secreted protein [Streptomyces sp. HNM0574]|uniref:putative T7SS-secreted protein n=1 Tax=Streptomyces sp. HNM0574 TaxID=2714954 RepID=UPI0019D1D078|nr:hypothetical protein [Streptomyces sp. HNM0574]
MAANPYPHLGWNPVPGIPAEVEALRTKVESAAKALRTSHRQIERLVGESEHWEGDAATAFREALQDELPEYMKNAARSMEKAAAELKDWDATLGSHRELARKYDDEAKDKKAAAGTAKDRYDEAAKHPDLGLGGKQYPTQAEADAATDRLRAAERRLSEASAAVEKANTAYDDVVKKAGELEKTHGEEAGKTAGKLDEADDKLAPKEPGWLSEGLSWVGDRLKDVGQFLLDHAGTIGAVAGLLALLPTPLAPAFAAVAVVASAASMAKNLSSEDFRDSLTGKHGGMEQFSAIASLGGDALGVVPGLGALGKAGGEVSMLAGAAREGGEVMSAGAKASTFGKEAVEAFRFKALDVATDPNTGVLQYAVNGANVAANTASSLETAGVLPSEGYGHNSAEVTKAGAASFGAWGTGAEFVSDMGDLVAGMRL